MVGDVLLYFLIVILSDGNAGETEAEVENDNLRNIEILNMAKSFCCLFFLSVFAQVITSFFPA